MTTKLNFTDQKFLNLAINLAKKNQSDTKENPSVGCVIVKNNNIIATATTAHSGRPHAESIALKKAGSKSKGADLYVSLEPCSHFGQTKPCVNTIIQHHIKRIIIATQDLDPRVNSNGIKKLQEQNIQVILTDDKKSNDFYYPYQISRKEKRSFVTIKIATSLDGKIACKNFQSKWITNQKTRNYTNFLRSTHNAILIGTNTLIKDNPNLDCRISGLENRSPTIIILTNHPDKITPNLNIFKNKNRQIIIATGNKAATTNPILAQLTHKIIICQANCQNLVNIDDFLSKTAQAGINSILVEGGKTTINQFVKSNNFDHLIHAQSPKIIGADGINIIDDLSLKNINDAINLKKPFKIKQFDEDFVKFYQNNNKQND